MSKIDKKVRKGLHDIRGRPSTRRTHIRDIDESNLLDEDSNQINDIESEETLFDGQPEEEDESELGDIASDQKSPYSRANQMLDQMKNQTNNETKYHSSDRCLLRPPLHQKSNKSQKSSNSGSILNWILILLSAFMALILGYTFFDGQRFLPVLQKYFTSKSEYNSDVRTKWQIFENEFKHFEQKYREVLPVYGIRVLNSSVKNVINRNKTLLVSKSPAIILLIGSQTNQNVLECIERDFVDIINKAYNEINPIVINGKQTNSRDISDSFDKNFRDHKKHTIIIKNIESIGAQDIMSLHQFTDHENARYKDVIIVLTAINYKEINLTKNAKLREMDSIATQLFQIKWKNALPEEQSFALISRLTPSVVTIIGKPENQLKC